MELQERQVKVTRLRHGVRITSYNVCYTKLLRYKLSAKGALPDGFWEAIREHTDRNVQLERERERHSKNISSTWPQFEDYIKVTGYDGDDWAKDQIQTGNRSNLTIKDDSHETEVTLSLDDKRRVYVA